MKKSKGYIIDIKRPTRPNDKYVACLVVTPKDGQKAVVKNKVQRNLGRDKALGIARELLESCGADDALLSQIDAMTTSGKTPLKA